MIDAALGGFSIFFTQSASFLEFQRNMALAKGRRNAATLFQMTEIPPDNHIRHLLDPVPPEELFPLFAHIIDGLYDLGYLDSYRSINGTLLGLMDTHYPLVRQKFVTRKNFFNDLRALTRSLCFDS